MVEQMSYTHLVGGSSPPGSTKFQLGVLTHPVPGSNPGPRTKNL